MPVRLLLVDNSPAFLEAAVCFLSADPHIEIAGLALSGRDALEQVARLHPDLVLLDLAMPEMNGLEATRRIKAQPGAPRVVILTLHDNPEYQAAAQAVGADGFVAKSEFGAQLLSLIHGLFAGPPARAPGGDDPRRSPAGDKSPASQSPEGATLQSLRESEARYRSLFDGVLVGLYRSTAEGRILDANPALVEMLGYPDRESLLTVNAADLYLHAEDRQREQALLVQQGIVRDFEMQWRRRDGAVIWVRDTARAACDADGRVRCYEGSLEDITERKRAEKALAAERLLLRTLVDHLPDAIYVKDHSCRKTLANPADVRNMGASSEAEALGKTDFDFYPHDLAAAFYADDQNVIQSGQPVLHREEIITLPDGTRGWQMTSKVPLRDSAGQVVGLVGIGHDITERKRAEEALSESEEKYRNVVERANDGITIIQDGMVQYANARLVEMWGGTVEEVIGTPFTRYIHPDEMPKVLDFYKRRMAGGDLPAVYETVLRHRDGSKAYAELNAGKITFQGRPADLVIVRDITERKQNEAALQKAKEELERQNARLQALYHVGQAVNSTLEIDAILEHLVGEAVRLTHASHGQVLVVREDVGLFERRSLRGFSPEEAELAHSVSLPLDRGLNGQAYATRHAVCVDDVRTIAGYFSLIPATRAEVAVPIVREGQVLGNLDLQSPETGAFHDVDLDYLDALADQVAIALEKARLFQAERQQRELAEALRQAAQAMGASLDLNEILRLILNQLKRVLVYDTASVLMFREGDVPDLAVGGGYADEQLTARKAGRLLRESPVLQRMARDLQPVVSADVRHLDGWIWVPGAEHVRSWLGIPLAAHGRLIGVLMADHSQPGFFGEAERQIAQALAQHAAQAIENARLYDEARRRNRELALLNRVIAASAASQDVASILETVCRELAQALGLPNASAALLNQAETEAVVVAEYRPQDRPSLLGATIPLPEDLRAVYLEQTTPLVVVDAQTDALLAPIRDLFRRRGTVSVLILPLLIEGEVAGSLLLGAAERHPFAAGEVELARRVAEQVSGALARARLEETHRRLTTAVEQAAEAVVITDIAGTILYANPAFEQSSGYSAADALGQHFRFLRSSKHDAAFYREMWQTLAGGRVWQGRMVNQKKGGSLYTADAVITPVHNQAGEIVSYVATMRDVTHEVELEEQFRQAQKMEAIGRLAGGVAHDFNNLLTIIHLSTRLLERKLSLESPLWPHVQRIREAGERATGLTRQLLAFSRQEAIEPKVLSLNDVVSNISKMLQRIIGEDVELTTSLAEGLWPVYADPTQIEQVILNLAVNARDAMPQGGALTIETANVTLDEAYTGQHLDVEPGEYVRLSISDTGSGMDDEVKKHLFEPFFTTKEKGKGTGLGLPIVFGAVKQNEGHVWVYSEVGLGTTFKIYLPRSEKAEAPLVARAHVRSPSLPPGGTETVLLVEDEAGVRELAAQILGAQGYQVLTAANGSEALRISGEHDGPIHLLLTDLVMPQMSGKELAEQLGSRRPEMRVLYMSGYTEDGIVQRRVIAGQVAFLSKPLTEESLIEKVRAALDNGT